MASGGAASPKDKLSRVVANYPVLEVYGKAGQLVSLDRLLAARALADGEVSIKDSGFTKTGWGNP